MEKNEFYSLKPLNKQSYNADRIHLESYEHKDKITFYKKLINTSSAPINAVDNDQPIINKNTKKAKKRKVKNKKNENEKVKNENFKKSFLSSVYNFNILESLLIKLKFKRINLLLKKLKKLKRRNNHIFFYIKDSKIFLILKKHVFKNGLTLLKTLVSNRVKKHEHSQNIKKFYTLLLN